MTETMPPLLVIAQPKAAHRERYICETDRHRNRSQRFVRAEENSYNFIYPTIEVNEQYNIFFSSFLIFSFEIDS